MTKHAGIYCRVSSVGQKHASQLPDLERWAQTQSDIQVRWYRDHFTGKTQDRPGWQALEKDLRASKISHLVCHRIDRLGRTARELLALFAELRERKVTLVVVTSGIVGLETPEGRLMAGIIANFAEFDNEVRSARILEGQSVARANGKIWGGSKPGVRKKITSEKLNAILKLKGEGTPIARIARAVEVSRQTVYSVLKESIS